MWGDYYNGGGPIFYRVTLTLFTPGSGGGLYPRDSSPGDLGAIKAPLYKIGFSANLQEFNIPSYSIGQKLSHRFLNGFKKLPIARDMPIWSLKFGCTIYPYRTAVGTVPQINDLHKSKLVRAHL